MYVTDHRASVNVHFMIFRLTKIIIKLFRKTNVHVIEECRLFLDILLPNEMLEIRRDKFNCKPMDCSTHVLNYFVLGHVQVTDYVKYIL